MRLQFICQPWTALVLPNFVELCSRFEISNDNWKISLKVLIQMSYFFVLLVCCSLGLRFSMVFPRFMVFSRKFETQQCCKWVTSEADWSHIFHVKRSIHKNYLYVRCKIQLECSRIIEIEKVNHSATARIVKNLAFSSIQAKCIILNDKRLN